MYQFILIDLFRVLLELISLFNKVKAGVTAVD